MYIKFTSPKRSKLNDVGLRVVQPSCTVTAISKFKSTTASLSVSTASLQPTQQQMLLWSTVQLKIFMASFPSPACKDGCSAEGSVSRGDGIRWAPSVFAHKPQDCWVGARLWEELQTQEDAGIKRSWMSPVTLQWDLLFSFRSFWNACKLWLR